PRRTGHVRPRPAQRNRPALPERPRPAPRAPHADRHHADPGQAQRNLRPRPLRAQAVTWVIRQGVSSKRLTSGNTPKINLARKLGLGRSARPAATMLARKPAGSLATG